MEIGRKIRPNGQASDAPSKLIVRGGWVYLKHINGAGYNDT